jgi:hypothetical protein
MPHGVKATRLQKNGCRMGIRRSILACGRLTVHDPLRYQQDSTLKTAHTRGARSARHKRSDPRPHQERL